MIFIIKEKEIMNLYEAHARDFLEYVSVHEEDLKKAVKKNITYDERIFDDTFQDAIIKIYDYIMTKEKFVNDFKNFFFICCKNLYIQKDTKTRKEDKILARKFFENLERPEEKQESYEDIKCYSSYIEEQKLFADDESTEENEQRIAKINELIEFTKDELEKQFDEFEVGLFLIYYRLKAEKEKISYKKLAEITNLDVKAITNILSKMKKYVRNSAEITAKKKKLLNDD